MILKLYFELEKNTLPSDYSPAFLSMIKNALSYSCEELYNSYYENNKSKEKNFCFAVRLPAPKFQNDKIELGDTNGDMQIHILDPEDAIDFYNAFMSQKNKSYPFPNGNKIKITKIEMRNHKTVTSNTILIKMNSPLLVRCHENGKDMYLSYKDENFQKYFFMSAAHTIKEILNIETPADSIHIEPVDARKTVVNTFGSKITGNIGIFKLTGSLTLLNTLIQQDSAADVLKVLAVLRSLWRCEQLLENCLKTELGSSFMLNAGICGFIRFMEHNNAEKGKDYDYQGQSLFIDIDYLKNNDISEMYISTMSEIFEENTKHFRTLNEKHEIDKLNSIGIDNLDDKQKK
ncbi:MAG: CRISPR-associated endoribonuclease Cas6, partial [Ruminococcus sp.]|nr:CRISPR-associated endoribonuclease Cas6 [Ruminococcus sp.]